MIDEWREAPAVRDAVCAEIDKHRRMKGLFILNSSIAPKAKGPLYDGNGKIVFLRMNTMTLFESGDSSGEVSLKELCRGNLRTQKIRETEPEKLAYFIIRGGFPENIEAPAEEAFVMPRAYMESVVREDLNKLDDGVKYQSWKVRLLLRSLARNESTAVSESSLVKDILENDCRSISRKTVSKYLSALDRLFLFNDQMPFFPNGRSSLSIKRSEKRHFSDPAMAAALLDMTQSKLLRDPDTFGFLFEALAERDLSVYARSFGGKLLHYQDYKNHRIDAVIEGENGEWCAFEIELDGKKVDESAENLNAVCAGIVKNGGKAPKIKCVICGLSHAAYRRPDGVFVVPLTALRE